MGPSCEDVDTWTGHATVVHEVKSDLEALGLAGVAPGAVVTCVGGGGLLAGILQGLGRVVQSRAFIRSTGGRVDCGYTRGIRVVHTCYTRVTIVLKYVFPRVIRVICMGRHRLWRGLKLYRAKTVAYNWCGA